MTAESNALRVLNERAEEIHLALQQGGIVGRCVACLAPSHWVRDVVVEHEDFALNLPLPICTRCASKPPFATGSLLDALRRLLGFWKRATRGVESPLSDSAVRPANSLQTLFDKIPQYRRLAFAFPEAALSSHRTIRLIDDAEADLFARSMHVHYAYKPLVNEVELGRSGLPFDVLDAYLKLADNQIKQIVQSECGHQQIVVVAAAVLLPGRQWRFDIQVSATSNRVPSWELCQKLEAVLGALPTWPVAYPVVFVVRRAFANPPEELYEEFSQPFSSWKTQVSQDEQISYADLALRVYDVRLPNEPVEPVTEDIVALAHFLPDSVPLKLLHAESLQRQEKHAEALEIFDALFRLFPDDAAIVLQRIQCLAVGGHLERAAAECQRRIAQHPQEAAAHAMFADLQWNLKQPMEALRQIDKALEIQEVTDYFQMRAAMLADLDRFSEAESAVNIAIFRDRDFAPAYLLRAKLHLRAGRHQQALADLVDFHRCGGTTLESLRLKTTALIAQGRAAEAEEVYRTACREAPQNLSLALQAVQFLAQQGKLETARQQCDAIIGQSNQFGAAYVIRAAIALETNQFAEAIRDCHSGLELGANGPQTFLLLGIAKACLGDLQQGLADLDHCIELASDYPVARYHRGRMHLALGEYENAFIDFSAALEMVPDWTDALVERGHALLAQQEQEKAIRDFDRALHLSPAQPEAYIGRALAHLVAGQKAAASDDLNKALMLDPSNLQGRLQRAVLLLEQSETELAHEDLNEVLAVQPDNAAALWQRAQLNLYAGRFTDAKKDFDRLIEIDPELPHSRIGRSIAFELSGDLDKAEADREEATRLAPFSSDQLTDTYALLCASVASNNEQFDRAIELATTIIEQQPELSWPAYRIRAHARWYSEDFVEALEDYSHIIEHCEEVTGHDFNAYGQVLVELGEFEKGLEALDRAVALAREQQDTVGLAFSLNGRGRALAGLENWRDADEAFAESLSLKPENAWLHFNRGLMYLERSEPQKVLACFELALAVQSPKLSPGRRRRASAFIKSVRGSAAEAQPTN